MVFSIACRPFLRSAQAIDEARSILKKIIILVQTLSRVMPGVVMPGLVMPRLSRRAQSISGAPGRDL
jgi:hypothetical protein